MSIEKYFDTIQRLYIAYYQRPADPGGLRHWAEKLEKAEGDVYKIVDYFVNSPESQALYSGLSLEEKINAIYKSAFNRDAEPEGLSFWVNFVKSGYSTIDRIVWDIVRPGSPQGDDAGILNNKIISANNFTEAIDPELDGMNFQVTYAGMEDAKKAGELLKEVSVNSGTIFSVEDAKAFIISSGIVDNNDALLSNKNPNKEIILSNAESKGKVNYGISNISDLFSYETKALDSEVHWNKKTITYSFLQSDPKLGYTNWRPLDSFQKELVREAFSKISSYIELKFVEVPSGGDIQFGSAELGAYSGVTQYSYIGNTFLPPVYIHFDNDLQDDREDYFHDSPPGFTGWGVVVFYHEIGHALGLKHPFEGVYRLSDDFDSVPYTVMSYTKGRIYAPYFYYDGKNIHCNYYLICTPAGLSILDLQALQAIYGANLNTNRENSLYDSDYIASSKNPFYMSIWDSGGVDTLDLSEATGKCIINLTDGSLSTVDYISADYYVYLWTEELAKQGVSAETVRSYVSENVYNLEKAGKLYTGQDNLSIVKGTVIENVKTGSADDIVYDNIYNNIIETGPGNDRIYISGGFDTVYGGAGKDTVYLSVSKSSVSIDAVDWYRIITGESFAVKIIGVEEIVFSDSYITV